MGVVILYEVEGEEQSSNFSNAMEIKHLSSEREIYLLDVMKYIESFQLSMRWYLTCSFYAILDDDLICLDSPSSLVPISSDGIIRLLLRPNDVGIIPHVPLTQTYQFAEKSRHQFYSASNFNKTKASAYVSFQERHKRVFSSDSKRALTEAVGSEIRSEKRGMGGHSYNRTDIQPNRDNFSRDSQKYRADPVGGRRSTEAANDGNFLSDDTVKAVNDAAEVAKVAAGVAARSLFSFASNIGKSVIDAASTVTAGTNAVSSSCSLAMGSTLQVGRMNCTVTKELAEGGFGMVYAVSSNHDGRHYALKQLICQSSEQIVEAHNELDILRRFRGYENIIELLEYSSEQSGSGNGPPSAANPRQVMMLFPLYPLGTAWDAISSADIDRSSRNWPFNEKQALFFIMRAAATLKVLHDQGFSHRDVKPHNFLLRECNHSGPVPGCFEPVLMDLGSITKARFDIQNKKDAHLLEEEAACKTSAAYRSPELTSPPFPPFQVDERVDTWGLGCTMHCLAFGWSPFESPKEGVMKLAILNGSYRTPPGGRNSKGLIYSDQFISMTASMLAQDISQRPFMNDVINLCRQQLD